MKNDSLFYATVTSVYPNTEYEVVGTNKSIRRDAYTIDVIPNNNFRGNLVNIPVVRFNSGGEGSSGTVCLPEKGDMVLCGYVEGFDNYPVCFGSITNKFSQQISPAGNQRHDITFQHISGSYIRMRGNGSADIEIKHNSGSTIKIDASGNVEITAGKVSVNSSEITLGSAAEEQLLKGNLFKAFYTDQIKTIIDAHTHLTIFGPTGVPTSQIPVFDETLLSEVTKTE